MNFEVVNSTFFEKLLLNFKFYNILYIYTKNINNIKYFKIWNSFKFAENGWFIFNSKRSLYELRIIRLV